MYTQNQARSRPVYSTTIFSENSKTHREKPTLTLRLSLCLPIDLLTTNLDAASIQRCRVHPLTRTLFSRLVEAQKVRKGEVFLWPPKPRRGSLQRLSNVGK